MPLGTGETAPYAPPATVLQVINAFRDRGLSTPITPDVLLRASINESIVPRTLKSLEGLELLDEAGNPTPAMEGLRRASSEDFKKRLEELVRGVYAEIFKFTDPAKDDLGRISDAFRAFNPIGQRGRMVTLFMGLCEAAGIIPAGTRKAPTVSPTGKPIKPKSMQERFAATRERVANERAALRGSMRSDNGTVPEPLLGLLRALPSNGGGWPKARRDDWLKLFGMTLDFTVPVREQEPAGGDEDEAEE
jgi:hypothetical protein